MGHAYPVDQLRGTGGRGRYATYSREETERALPEQVATAFLFLAGFILTRMIVWLNIEDVFVSEPMK